MSKGNNKDKDRILRKGQLPPHIKARLQKTGVLMPKEEGQGEVQGSVEINTKLIEQLFTISRQLIELVKSQEEDIREIKTLLAEAMREGERKENDKQG